MKRATMIYGFWERIEQVIAADGRTKEQLAELMGCERKVLYNRGGAMHATYIARFCAVTGASADYLLGLKEG